MTHFSPDPNSTEELDRLFDQAVTATRDDEVSDETVARAAADAWTAISTHMATDEGPRRIESCDDYQALLPDLVAGRLPAARRTLVEQHTRECVPCRRALTTLRTERAATTETVKKPRRSRSGAAVWMPLAAALMLAALGLATLFSGGVPFLPKPVLASVDFVDGELLKVADDGTLAPWAVGEEIREGDVLRTAKGSGAVLALEDGTLIEMNERAELALDKGLRGRTIDLERGDILVEAAKQRNGKLYVATDDCTVSVVGTVFAVDHGFKGSRVSVLEGEVHVAAHSGTDVLLPGDQTVTRASLARVPLEDEVAWSRRPERFRALLDELRSIRRELDERLPQPELRFASPLLGRVPAETIGYVAVPNMGEAVGETYDVIQERLDESPVLAEWWRRTVVANGQAPMIEMMVTKIRDLGSFLGDEVVVAVTDVEGQGPVALAQVTNAALADFLQRETAGLPVTLVSDPSEAVDRPDDHLWVWIGDGVMVASPSALLLRQVAGGDSGFTATSFHRRLAQAYGGGIEWLFAADVASALDAADPDDPSFEASGFADLEHVLVERHTVDGRAETRGTVGFANERRGLASWLAAPAPMGSLSFVSANAPMVAAAVVRDPAAMVEELAKIAAADGSPGALDTFFDEAERELGIDLRSDVVAALGGEVALALDGPVLPKPSWKLIAEVYEPGRLQNALEALAARAEAQASAEGHDLRVTLTANPLGGRDAYTLAVGGAGMPSAMEVHYLYADGYLVAAPSRALLERALQTAASGADVTTSRKFRELLPADAETHFSAVLFQDMGSLLGDGSGMAPSAGGEADLGTLIEVARHAPPTLGYAYGRDDAIEVSAATEAGAFGAGLLEVLGGLLGQADGEIGR